LPQNQLVAPSLKKKQKCKDHEEQPLRRKFFCFNDLSFCFNDLRSSAVKQNNNFNFGHVACARADGSGRRPERGAENPG
ncbi:MAG: hypothetical protein ACPGJE_07665, partial [Wenzhouxiangellaceae bacterium]